MKRPSVAESACEQVSPSGEKGRLLGRYVIESELGAGGMGKVYAATVREGTPSLAEGTRVALKIIHSHLLETPGVLERFLREAELGKAILHPNVVRTLDCDAVESDGVSEHFLVMEYVEGRTLRALVSELGTVPEALCRHIALEVAKGLAAIHEAGAIHRDIKPANVLITKDHAVKIMDLGVARIADELVRLSGTGMFLGSLGYAAPEQFTTGKGVLDGRADLHALGVMLYELATGEHPYREADTQRMLRRILDGQHRRAGQVNALLSPFFEEVVRTLMERDRDLRFSSAGALADVLEAAEAGDWWKERLHALARQPRRSLRRPRISRDTAVCGREPELAKLRALYEKARAGDGGVLLIDGEAGIGKTRLVDEFVGSLEIAGEEINFLYGSYPPGGAATGCAAFRAAYCDQIGEEGSAAYLAETPLLVPAFDALLRGDAPPAGAAPLTKESLQTCFVHVTRKLASHRPTVILIDDLHFAPEEGRALFAALALAVPGHRILLMGTTRPGLEGRWISNLERIGAVRLALSRLSPDNVMHLLADNLGSESMALQLITPIASKSDGNPFFALEILRALREGGFLERNASGSWERSKALEEVKLPASVRDLVDARVAELDEEERRVLDVACCVGFQFDATLVGEVLGLARVAALQIMAKIERRHHLVQSSGRVFTFDHHQIQESLYDALSEPLREAYHASIAEALEARHAGSGRGVPDLEGAHCVALAEHFLKGARGDGALPYLDAALTHLEANHLAESALHLSTRALDEQGLLAGAARCELVLRKAAQLRLLGRYEEERQEIENALGVLDGCHAEGAPLRLRAWLMLGQCFLQTSRHDAAEVVLREALAVAEEAERPAVEAQIMTSLGNVYLCKGRTEKAGECFRRGLALSRQVDDRSGEAHALDLFGSLLCDLGRLGEAQEHHERALAFYGEIADFRGEASATMHLGVVLSRRGRVADARQHYEQALSSWRKCGERMGEARATLNLGIASCDMGQFQAARESLRRCRALCMELGNRRVQGIATVHLGTVFSLLGRQAESLKNHAEGLALSLEVGDRRSEASANGALGKDFELLGLHARAEQHHERSLAIARGVGDLRGESSALAGLGRLACERGDVGESVRLHEQALALGRSLSEKLVVAGELIQLGRLMALQGETSLGTRYVAEAQDLAERLGSPEWIVSASVEWAHLRQGDQAALAAARDKLRQHENQVSHELRMRAHFRLWEMSMDLLHLDEAYRLLASLREHAPSGNSVAWTDAVPLHRDLLKAWAKHRDVTRPPAGN